VNTSAWIINLIAIGCLVLAFITNRNLALTGLKKGLRILASIAPVTVLVVAIVSIILAFVPPESISTILGESSGVGGIMMALGLGAVVHMPALLGFPLAGKVLANGGAAGPVAAFITSLTMIGIFTIPMEIKILGKRFALARNILSASMAFIVAIMIGVLL
jgi:uncharacterized membrane protein YraQ (UPF0718 family)